MKNRIVLAAFLSIVLFLCSCEPTSKPDSSNGKSEAVQIIESGRNFQIERSGDISGLHPELNVYRCSVFDNAGNIMQIREIESQRLPRYDYIDDNTLRMRYGAGNVTGHQYFDVEKGFISPLYTNPQLVENGRIVYMTRNQDNVIVLVVSDLYDPSKYYEEFMRDFSPVAVPYNTLHDAEFIDEKNLKVTYITGTDYQRVTEIIYLEEMNDNELAGASYM